MSYLQAALLGLIQGLTEFLPVSSSGHLAIFKNIFGVELFECSLTFDLLLHIGTLIAVFVVYYKDIWELIKEFFGMVGDICRGKNAVAGKPYRRFIIMLLISMIPTLIIGLLVKDFVESIAGEHLYVVGLCLLVTSVLLYASDKFKKGKYSMENAPYPSALTVGLFQSVAMLPGISRSGSTIVGGLLGGFERDFAVKFSFILSIPTILGASLIDFIDVMKTGVQISVGPAILGVVISAVSGFMAIRFLLKVIQNRGFKMFSYYCAAAGILTLILSIF